MAAFSLTTAIALVSTAIKRVATDKNIVSKHRLALEIRSKRDGMTTVNRLFDIAKSRFEKGQGHRAEPLLQQVLAQCPDHVAGLILMGKIALEQNRADLAVSHLAAATAITPDNGELFIQLGRAYLKQKQLTDAVTCFERAAHLLPGDGTVHRYLSTALRLAGKLPEAYRHAEQACALLPHDAQSLAAKGHICSALGKIEQALDCYERSLAIDPDDWEVYRGSGIALVYLGRLKEAASLLTFANALEPMNPEVAVPLAGVLVDLNRHDDAALLLKKLSVLAPKDDKVHVYSGINAYKQGKPVEAVAHHIQAMALGGARKEIPHRLADALCQEGRLDNADAVLKQHLDTCPDDPEAQIFRARIALLSGRMADAKTLLRAMHQPMGNEHLWNGETVDTGVRLRSRFGAFSLLVLLRLVPSLLKKCASVSVACPRPFHALLNSIPGVTGAEPGTLPASGEPVADIEALIPLLEIEDAPSFGTEPLLTMAPERVNRFKPEFLGVKGPKIGIMWRHETHLHRDVYHDIPLEALRPLFKSNDYQLISVQTETGLDEREHADDMMHLSLIQNARLDERLACIANLDLLITPNTLTGQAAAAAGLPVWFLLGTVPDWHFGLTAPDSPWHPGAQLLRQSNIGQWDDVVAQAQNRLDRFAEQR